MDLWAIQNILKVPAPGVMHAKNVDHGVNYKYKTKGLTACLSDNTSV